MGNFFRKSSLTADTLVCPGSGARHLALLELGFARVVMPSSHGV